MEYAHIFRFRIL